ncbi:MAG: MFS transporter, partial [Rhodobacteraceae bacterium]|nr:MFS transporter [Paracoccaceae bacterium]
DAADRARANGAIAQLGNVGTASSTPLFALAAAGGLVGTALLTMLISALGFTALWLIHRKIAKTA